MMNHVAHFLSLKPTFFPVAASLSSYYSLPLLPQPKTINLLAFVNQFPEEINPVFSQTWHMRCMQNLGLTLNEVQMSDFVHRVSRKHLVRTNMYV